MKKAFKFAALLLALILLLALGGCVRVDGPGTIAMGFYNGNNYVLSPGENSLEYKGVTYQYDVAREKRQLTFTVTYPNGGIYQSTRGTGWEKNETEGLYDPVSYAPGAELVDILSRHYSIVGKGPSAANVICALLFLAIGAFHAFFPEDAWDLSHALRAWQYVSVEPSQEGISMTRMVGIVTMVIGVIVFFIYWR